MGNRAVELPKTVDQLVRELRDGCDRLCGTVDRRCRARGSRGGETRQREEMLSSLAVSAASVWAFFIEPLT
jgi:hypothetical protein